MFPHCPRSLYDCIPPPCPLFLSAQRCKKWALWVGHGGKGGGCQPHAGNWGGGGGGGLLKPCPKCRPGRDGYMSAVYSTYCVRVRGCGIDQRNSICCFFQNKSMCLVREPTIKMNFSGRIPLFPSLCLTNNCIYTYRM